MIRGRRIVKQWREIAQWSINNSCPPIHSNKCRDLSTAVKRWRGTPQWPTYNLRCFESRLIRHPPGKVGYTVDVADLLFTPERDFLLKNNAQKGGFIELDGSIREETQLKELSLMVDDLRGKTIVLFIVPLDERIWRYTDMMWDTRDMIDAYYELLRVGGCAVEFVCVPLRLLPRRAGSVDDQHDEEEASFHDLFSTMPFPAIPLSDAQGREGPLVQTFSLDHPHLGYDVLPYWVVIDPTNTVVATRYLHPTLFQLFGGAELYPLSRERIEDLEVSHESESRFQRINKWDQLLASDTRDFLLSSNGEKIPISSLKGKLVGLYFCENIPNPPRMKVIKKVYEEAKSRGYDFEIVQITFHYHPFNARHLDTDPTVQQCCEDVSWLTLPFKDPSCRKIQRILHCIEEEDDIDGTEYWVGDTLILIYPRQGEAEAEADHSSGVIFELLGAEILKRWGIEGYPFTRKSVCKVEYEIQKRDVTLESLLPATQCLLRSVGDGFDLVDADSQLSGKRVLVFFAPHLGAHSASVVKFVSMLKSEYEAQPEEESKFEVMYVSTAGGVSSFKEFIKDMPWLILPISSSSNLSLGFEVFKVNVSNEGVAAFNEQGRLIAKARHLPDKEEGDKFQFPFIDQDLEECISEEVDAMCVVSNYRD